MQNSGADTVVAVVVVVVVSVVVGDVVSVVVVGSTHTDVVAGQLIGGLAESSGTMSRQTQLLPTSWQWTPLVP